MPFFRSAASTLALTLAMGVGAYAQTETPPAEGAAPATEAPAATEATPAEAVPEGISGTYTIDSEHSHVVFKYDHMGFSTSHGLVTGVTGTIKLDEANKANSTVEASFPLSAVRTVSPQLDKDLQSDEFFKGQPLDTQVTFKSTSVEPDGDEYEAKVTGDLTLNGVTKPVTLEVSMRKVGIHPMTGKPSIGFDIEGEIKRSDFNLGAFAPAVSDELEFDIEVEATK